MLNKLGRIVLGLATMLLIAFVSLFVLGTYLTTWPILRLSPRNQRVKTAMTLASAVMSAIQVWTNENK